MLVLNWVENFVLHHQNMSLLQTTNLSVFPSLNSQSRCFISFHPLLLPALNTPPHQPSQSVPVLQALSILSKLVFHPLFFLLIRVKDHCQSCNEDISNCSIRIGSCSCSFFTFFLFSIHPRWENFPYSVGFLIMHESHKLSPYISDLRLISLHH